MSKYNSYQREQEHLRRKTVHPIWRGIGFIMIVLIPIMGYAVSLLLLQANVKNGWVAIPRDLIAKGADPDLYLKIILTIAAAFLLYAVFTLVSVAILRAFGPPRYGPTDVPAGSSRVKKRY